MSKSIVGQVRIKNGSNFTVLAENAGDALVMRLGNNPEYIIASGFNPDRFDWDSGKYFGQDLEKVMYEWYIEEEVENFENIRKHKVEEDLESMYSEEDMENMHYSATAGKEIKRPSGLTATAPKGIFFNEDGEEAVEGEDLLILPNFNKKGKVK